MKGGEREGARPPPLHGLWSQGAGSVGGRSPAAPRASAESGRSLALGWATELTLAWPGGPTEMGLGGWARLKGCPRWGVCTLHVDLHGQAAEAVHPPEKSHGLFQGRALQRSLEGGPCRLVIHLGADEKGWPLSTRSPRPKSGCSVHPTVEPTRPSRPLSHAPCEDTLIQVLQATHLPTPRVSRQPFPSTPRTKITAEFLLCKMGLCSRAFWSRISQPDVQGPPGGPGLHPAGTVQPRPAPPPAVRAHVPLCLCPVLL